MMLPGNACPVVGSFMTVPGSWLEKLPVRHASSGTVGFRLFCTVLPRDVSNEKKKNVLLCPLYTRGTYTGPPTEKPGRCEMPEGRCNANGSRERNTGVP